MLNHHRFSREKWCGAWWRDTASAELWREMGFRFTSPRVGEWNRLPGRHSQGTNLKCSKETLMLRMCRNLIKSNWFFRKNIYYVLRRLTWFSRLFFKICMILLTSLLHFFSVRLSFSLNRSGEPPRDVHLQLDIVFRSNRNINAFKYGKRALYDFILSATSWSASERPNFS